MKILIEHDSDKPKLLRLINTTEELDLPNSGPTKVEPRYWDGNSTPPLPLMRYLVPKFYYMIASLFHDELCARAKTKADRKNADKDYKWILINLYKAKVSAFAGFIGVRMGALFSINGKED